MHASPSKRPPKPKSFRLHRRGSNELGLAVAGPNYWWRLGRKIALMSAHASVLLALAFLPLTLWFMVSAGAAGGGLPGVMVGMMLGTLFISLPMGWVVSYLWNGLLGLVLIPSVHLGQRLIGEPISRDTTGWIAGSAIAIVGSAGGLFQISTIQASSAAFPFEFVWMLAVQIAGGLLGIAAAQAGGYLGSLGALRRRRRVSHSKPVRFSVWRIMAMMAILSVLLSLIRLTGELAVPLIISLLVSSLLAWAIHRPVAWATNRWLDWRLKKRRAKRNRAAAAA